MLNQMFSKKKKLKLAVFGCGYVGLTFVKEALKEGFQVSTLTHNGEKTAALKSLGVTNAIEAELESESWHKDIDPEQDWVLNVVSAASGGIDGFRRSYLEGQKSVVKWMGRGKVNTFIYTSSTSVYPQDNAVWVDEKSATDNVNERSQILLEGERVLQACSAQTCQRWFILRLAGIYGPRRHYILDRLRRGETVFEGSGDAILNLIHRDDICSALWAVFQSSNEIKNQIFNVCDNSPSPKKEVVNWLAKKLGSASPVFDPCLTTKRFRQRQLPNGRLPNRFISNKKICEILQWQPQHPSFPSGYEAILNP